MGWNQKRIYKSPPSQTPGIGPPGCQDALVQIAVDAWVLVSGIQIICKLLVDLRLLAMQGETIIVTLTKKCQLYLPQPPNLKFQ